MRTHNALRYIPELIRGIGIIAGLDDAEGGVERLGETLTPMINPWRREYDAYVIGERWNCGGLLAPAVAAQFSASGLRNPVGSKYNLIVQEMRIGSSAVADQYQLRYRAVSAVGITATATTFSRDTRFNPGGNAGSAQNTTGASAAAANFGVGPIAYWNCAANVTVVHNGQFILSPGWELFIVRNTVNNVCLATFDWRESYRYPGQT